MTQFKAMKFRIANPEQSTQLQEVLFKFGTGWYGDPSTGVAFTSAKFLFVEGKFITYETKNEDYFKGHDFKEMDTDQFIKQHTKPVLQRHKHYDMIVAAAEGKTIQYRYSSVDDWKTVNPSRTFQDSSFMEEWEYRIKPEPVEMWRFAYGSFDGDYVSSQFYASEQEMRTLYESEGAEINWVVKLEPTGKLVEPE